MQSIHQKGMTLIELTVVLLILIALAGLAIPYVGGTNRMALCQATDASMQAIKTAIMGGGANTGFYMDTLGYYPQNTPDKQDHNDYDLRYLFEPTGFKSTYNPKTAVGWRGPYLMSGGKVPAGLDNSFKNIYDPGTVTGNVVHTDITTTLGSRVLDAWGRPIIIQVPYSVADSKYKPDYARLVSAGAGNGMAPGDAVIDTTIHDNQGASGRGDDRVLFLKMPDLSGNKPCNE
ncbi:MAG: prepilin-type N-terminal cleavage/methylation domain-containing protein [Methylococcales bacterium]|nr:prepilin-type N-terminal cleavage/methylation domain-containing protein [Methylococcales bacterium]